MLLSKLSKNKTEEEMTYNSVYFRLVDLFPGLCFLIAQYLNYDVVKVHFRQTVQTSTEKTAMHPGTFQPGTAAVAPATQVEITVSCRNLADQDLFSKSDPMCVLRVGDFKTKQLHEHGRTEMIKDSLNPDFVKKFVINYLFEERQMLKFEIYDVDSPSQRLDHHDFLGTYECSLGELVSAPGGKVQKKLQGRATGRGVIILRTEEVSSCKEEVTMQLKASKLDKKDFLGKSDPFLVFYKANEDGSYSVVHKTEVIKNNLNPTWRPFTIPVRSLCNGDYDRSIRIECFDWDSDGGHDLIGEFQSNMREFTKGPGTSNVYPVINPHKKKKKKHYTNSGVVEILMCKIQQTHSFLDFIKGGMQMNFTVAIDFTASNGNPATPTSLHYINPQQPNQYAAAIQAVGEIIQDYDSDKLFPVLGFGAKLPTGNVSHEFALNFNPTNPYVSGVEGILQVYHQALQRVQLYGPTNFSPIINHVSKFASAAPDGSNYFVLLIITDGVITDMPNTIEAIVRTSSLPMSIIIVGVGNAEFDSMNLLDADDQRLSSNGRYAERDIVQFVPFRNFVGGRYGSDLNISKAYLAKEVLAEIPTQVTDFMKKRAIKPKPPQENVVLPGTTTNNVAPGTDPYPAGSQTNPSLQRGTGHMASIHSPHAGEGVGVQGMGPYQGAVPQGSAPYPEGQQLSGAYPVGSVNQKGPAPQAGGGAPGYAASAGTQQWSSPYPGAPQGSAPYPGGTPQGNMSSGGGVGQPSYTSSGSQGSVPYPGAAPGTFQGTVPYPGVAPNQGIQQGSAPYQSGTTPYPAVNQQASAPYPQGSAPNPGGATSGSAPLPRGVAQGSAPYPGGAPQGSAPYPGGATQGSAPYPGGAPPYPGGAPPYPGGAPQGSAPYPGRATQGTAPYPGGATQGSASYPGGATQGSAPYPGGAPQGSAPYPGGAPQGSASYPGGAPQGSAPYPGGAPQGSASYPGGAPQGSVPYPGGQHSSAAMPSQNISYSGGSYPAAPQDSVPYPQANAPSAPPRRRTAPMPPGASAPGAPPPYPRN